MLRKGDPGELQSKTRIWCAVQPGLLFSLLHSRACGKDMQSLHPEKPSFRSACLAEGESGKTLLLQK